MIEYENYLKSKDSLYEMEKLHSFNSLLASMMLIDSMPCESVRLTTAIYIEDNTFIVTNEPISIKVDDKIFMNFCYDSNTSFCDENGFLCHHEPVKIESNISLPAFKLSEVIQESFCLRYRRDRGAIRKNKLWHCRSTQNNKMVFIADINSFSMKEALSVFDDFFQIDDVYRQFKLRQAEILSEKLPSKIHCDSFKKTKI